MGGANEAIAPAAMVTSPGHDGRRRANVARLERGCGGRPRGLERGSEAPQHGDDDAKKEKEGQRERRGGQRRREAPKIPRAEIGTDDPDRSLRQDESAGQSERAAGDTH